MKTLLFLFLSLLSVQIHAQNIQFAYDEAGNRISRLQVTADLFIEQEVDSFSPQTWQANNQFLILADSVCTDLNVSIEKTLSDEKGTLFLFDAQGKTLTRKEIELSSFTFPMRKFAPGVYYMRLVWNNRMATWKLNKSESKS